ncbi:GPI-anchored cell wall beta-1,3-endoglucanase EglC [Colletotrichum higginsianum]|uniref:GPI-anchored cell wall beta-1,3-endoglucanase EglC n=2 Tax=Colletotrichum higginsianum TaxID=80884 RepID=H1VL72_COLHI|nr:GPI-anchored cell wall beta-1,3-endoglucanase EglC [Colletotrichum higginsianum IMI 349063]OBR02513.1 GPI-anchored cell wall beta-1,3-endoglucanase EglC [Colletotrichum higginsianum IMI 349063]TID06159.1 putative glucan endo-1,3-beta-glucosidase eglC [Colletotrichum higginsianum]CCF40975.1 GPI-anchored cell wall beta-1,3-endoglucanase EglC [Colletotrichum higginsianum]
MVLLKPCFLTWLAIGAAGQQMPSGLLGFNSGATKDNNDPKDQSDFQAEFTTAQGLRGSPGAFNSVRLYTMIQAGTTNDPISAFPAALATNTSMLLGIWCSGTQTIENELAAMRSAIDRFGQRFADLVVGISVGSEDLYRLSESGIQNNAGLGQGPDIMVRFIREVRDAIEGTILSGKPVGHVDAWSAFGNESNSRVVDELDWLGTDLYPYYEADKGNDIGNATTIFDYIYNVSLNATRGKPLWVTETGYPASGPVRGQAVASVSNAAQFWQEIGCDRLFGRVNTWWYTLRDSNPANAEKFAITEDLKKTAKFNLTCAPGSGAPAAINLTSKASSLYTAQVLWVPFAVVLGVLVGL